MAENILKGFLNSIGVKGFVGTGISRNNCKQNFKKLGKHIRAFGGIYCEFHTEHIYNGFNMRFFLSEKVAKKIVTPIY